MCAGVTIIGNDREEKTPVDGTKVVTVTYNNVTEEQVESLTHISSFCFQPVKYDCYNTLVYLLFFLYGLKLNFVVKHLDCTTVNYSLYTVFLQVIHVGIIRNLMK